MDTNHDTDVSRGASTVARGQAVIAKTLDRYPVAWERGAGARLYDSAGRSYLDFFTGHGVHALGHCHPRVVAAQTAQLARLAHVGNHYWLEPQVRLAERLVDVTYGNGARVFFANSGAEVVELSIKLVRRHAAARGRGAARTVICMENSFHGRTYGALTATGQDEFKRGMAPMLPGIVHVPFNDAEAARRAVDQDTCAILVEPVLGDGGVVPAAPGYLAALRTLCDERGILLVFDEIGTGLGRTGALFAFQREGVVPDVLLLGKALGAGLPLSALVARPGLADVLGIGDHGSTCGGNPVAAAGGLVLLEELLEGDALARAAVAGETFGARLDAVAARHPGIVVEARGVGLLRGLVLERGGREAAERCLERGLVVNHCHGETLRFLPPLTVAAAEIEEACAVLDEVLGAL